MNKEVILAHLKTVKEAAEVALQNCIERDKKTRSKGGGITFNMGTTVRICDVSLKISVDGEEELVVEICKAQCGLLCGAIYEEIKDLSSYPISIRSDW